MDPKEKFVKLPPAKCPQTLLEMLASRCPGAPTEIMITGEHEQKA